MIKLKNVSKKYIITHEKQALVRNILPGVLRRQNSEEFWALRDVNLEVNSNKVLGVIGKNGSGKTTLLNIIAGTTSPTKGRVDVKGKVSTLLTLGAGFHPELTGKENIFLNGTILGMTEEKLRRDLRKIIDFAELSNFIDVPLRTYSDGMKMRLGFAIAAHVDFDILLVDEILSVGDIAFQQKCLDKMRSFCNAGKTIVLASHSLSLVKDFCPEVILLDCGRIVDRGNSVDTVDKYKNMINVPTAEIAYCNNEGKTNKEIHIEPNIEHAYSKQNGHPPTIINHKGASMSFRGGTGEAQITNVRFIDYWGRENSVFKTGEKMRISVDYTVNQEIFDPHFGIAIFKDNGIYCFGPNTRFDKIKIERLKKGNGQFSLEYESLNLLPGRYLVSVAIWQRDEKFAYDNHFAYYPLEIKSDKKDHGICFLKHKWKIRLPK